MLKSLGEAGARLCYAVLFIIAARMLGQDDWGLFTYAGSVAALAVVGVDLGLNTLIIRDGARDPEKLPLYAGNILIIKSVLVVMVLGLLLLFCRLQGHDAVTSILVMAMALNMSIGGIKEFAISGLNALECMDKEAIAKIASRVTALLLCGAGLLYGLGLTGLVGGILVSSSLGCVLAMIFLARRIRFDFAVQKGFLGYLFRESLPLALNNIFILVYFRVDILMLEFFGQSMASIGWYGAGVRLIDAVGMLPGMISLGMMPVLSSLAGRDPAAMRRLYAQGQSLLLILGIPAAVGLYALRQEVVLFVFGEQFAPTAQAFVWLAPVLAMLFLNYMQLKMLTVLGRQRLCAWSTGLCVLVNIGLNLVLIPRYGYVGAAAATLATEAVLLLLCGLFLHRLVHGTGQLLRQTWRPALAAGIMWLALWAGTGLWLPLSILLGGLVYLGALFAVRGITPAQGRELLAIVRGRSGPESVKI